MFVLKLKRTNIFYVYINIFFEQQNLRVLLTGLIKRVPSAFVERCQSVGFAKYVGGKS